jgi:hypothetical protein
LSGAGDGLSIASIDVETPIPVPSGGQIEVVVRGTSPGPDKDQIVVLRVRSLQTGQMMYAVNNNSRGIQLEQGPFELATRLTMNVPEGMYSIESLVARRSTDRDTGHGPAALIHVAGGPSFQGSVQMHAIMETRPRQVGGVS